VQAEVTLPGRLSILALHKWVPVVVRSICLYHREAMRGVLSLVLRRKSQSLISSPCRLFSSQKLSVEDTVSQKHGEILTFHKREMPPNLTALSSVEGRRMFRESLDNGHMESYFPLSEQFLTQSEPAFCSLTSLAMVLNALNHDPGKVWKAPWRWISEETLRCGPNHDHTSHTHEHNAVSCGNENHSFPVIKKKGLNFSEFENLAYCHDISIRSYRVDKKMLLKNNDNDIKHEDDHDTICGRHGSDDCHNHGTALDTFRSHVLTSARAPSSHGGVADFFIIANFDRSTLQQTGDGHFSPIAGYHQQSDSVLILDTARFKYPPWWVKVENLWEAMQVPDVDTQESRGYFLIDRVA
jgi:glutathione gamma-glutamylcysteinyltransferase